MIEVSQLTKRYGDRLAIDHLDFKVAKGEVVGFLGPNGAGKSTTMKIITGFMAPTSGFARVGGLDVFDSPIEVKKKIGYLPETPPVYTDMRVADFLEYVAELKDVPKLKIKSQVANAIEKTQLQSVASRLIGNLSKGFRQRVGIAQALVSDPEVLILDEPTVGLDPKQVAEIRDLIRELRGQHTIILSTHILPEVQAVCERIVIIHQGKIVAQDTLENLSRLQTGGKRIELVVRRSTDELKKRLQEIKGVRAMTETAALTFILDAEGNDSMTDEVARCVIDHNVGLVSIQSSMKADLEEIFLKLTYHNAKGGQA